MRETKLRVPLTDLSYPITQWKGEPSGYRRPAPTESLLFLSRWASRVLSFRAVDRFRSRG